MDKIKDNINILYQKIFAKDTHVFFTDIERVNRIAKQYTSMQKKIIKHKIPFNKNVTIPFGNILNLSTEKYKTLSDDIVKDLIKEMHIVLNWDKILKIVSLMSTYLLKSSFDNNNKIDMLYDTINKSSTINIMIIGSGPVGLFLASYLKSYYSNIKVNIVLYDSRIEKPGFRKPYTRQRPFNTSSSYLSLIIPKIYCWNKNKDNLFVNIFMLEYLLYCTAISKYNIPIIYNDYNWDDYKKIIERGNFKVVFDCTGGRLKTDAINITPQDIKWIDNFEKENRILNKTLIIKPEKNLVELGESTNIKKSFIKNYYYGSISVHKNDKMLTFINKYDIDIVNKYDLVYLSKTAKLEIIICNIILQ